MSANTGPAESEEGWPAAWSAALSDASLAATSSAAIVARGAGYARSGAVRVEDEDPMPEPALRARVAGTSVYDVEVWIEADAVAGDCSCPHAADGWFCKHQIAVAMVWRQRLAGSEPAASPPTAGRGPRTALERRQALQVFLHGQDAPSLADKLLDLAARDRDVERELQQWRKLGALEGDWAAIRRVVSDMLAARRDFIAWDEGEDYVARAGAVLPVLRQAIARDPAAAVSLALHALRSAWAALEVADDSDGVIGDFCGAIGEEFVAALEAAPAPPSSFGEVYLSLRMDEPLSAFDACQAEAAMGDAALSHYCQALRLRWQAGVAAGPSSGKPRQALDTVERLHLDQLVRAGELDEALAVLRSDLSTPGAHRRLIRFLEEHGRFREAFTAAEAAVRQHPDDRLLEDDLLRCYERDGWTEEAFALRQRRFERQPTVEGYRAAVAAGEAGGRPAGAVRAALFDVLTSAEQRAIDDEAARTARLQPRGRRSSATAASLPLAPNVSLRASILCAESRWLDAWAAVQAPNVCTDAVLRQVARNLPATHHADATGALLQVFERAMNTASSPYRDELVLVADIVSRMPADRRAAWLRELQVRFKAKRNFVRDLPER